MKAPKSLFKARRRSGTTVVSPEPHNAPAVFDADDRPFGADDPHYIATHEAGHAVAAVVLGFRLKSVDIERRPLPGGLSVGFTDTGRVALNDVVGKGEEAAMPHLVLSFAGYVAEGYVNPMVYEGGGYHRDLEDARRTAAAACCALTKREDGNLEITPEEQRRNGDRLTALLASAVENSNQLVRDHWPAIEQVAALLVERKKLSGAEVAAIVNAALS